MAKSAYKRDLIIRLRKRAEIRRSIVTRKSVQNGEPDRIADLLEEAATTLEGKQEKDTPAWLQVVWTIIGLQSLLIVVVLYNI